MHLDRKSDNTIIEDKPWPAKNRILSITGSKAASRCGSSSQRSLLPVGIAIGSTKRSWGLAHTIT
jgi:hypothetical protein